MDGAVRFSKARDVFWNAEPFRLGPQVGPWQCYSAPLALLDGASTWYRAVREHDGQMAAVRILEGAPRASFGQLLDPFREVQCPGLGRVVDHGVEDWLAWYAVEADGCFRTLAGDLDTDLETALRRLGVLGDILARTHAAGLAAGLESSLVLMNSSRTRVLPNPPASLCCKRKLPAEGPLWPG